MRDHCDMCFTQRAVLDIAGKWGSCSECESGFLYFISLTPATWKADQKAAQRAYDDLFWGS